MDKIFVNIIIIFMLSYFQLLYGYHSILFLSLEDMGVLYDFLKNGGFGRRIFCDFFSR